MQTNNGLYKQNESYAQLFIHSCLGRLLIMVAILAAIAGIASLTVPSDDALTAKMKSSIYKCITANYEEKCDKIDDAVRNLTEVFASPDSVDENSRHIKDFNMYNKIEIRRHALYNTAYVRNNLTPNGIRIGIGFMGMTIPTVHFSDMILRVGPVRKDYNQRIIRNSYSTDDLGNNPDFGDTYNTYQGGGSSNQ